ncbi:MAG: hypothetical protein ACREPR_23805, partial [Brasilonema sp.]
DLQEVTEVVNEQQLLVTTSESTKSALPPSPFLRKIRQINSKSPKIGAAEASRSRHNGTPHASSRRSRPTQWLGNPNKALLWAPTSLKIQNSKYVLQTSYALAQLLRKRHKIWKFSSSPHSVSSKSESESNKGEILRQQQNTTQVEAKPDWIETQAQTIGYQQHLLERILDSLDRVMLWLEDIFVEIGLFLRRLLRRK